MTAVTARTHAPTATNRDARHAAGTIVGTTAVAVAVNVAVWALGRALGVSFADSEASVPATGVAMITAVPFLLGLTITALVASRRPGFVRVAKIVGPAIAVCTIGLTVAATFDAASTVFLGAMHLILIPTLLAGLSRLER